MNNNKTARSVTHTNEYAMNLRKNVKRQLVDTMKTRISKTVNKQNMSNPDRIKKVEKKV